MAIPRLLHILALAYIISILPSIRVWAQSRLATPLALFGRYGLAVFAAGTVVDLILQVVRAANPESVMLDTAMIAGGLVFLYALARTKHQLSAKPHAKA